MNKYLSIIILFIIGSISACKKYEEGPYISFRSKNARLINDWTCVAGRNFETLQILGGEQIDMQLYLYDDGIFKLQYPCELIDNFYTKDSLEGTWTLAQNDEVLEFDCSIFYEACSDLAYDSLFYMDIKELKYNRIKLLDPENKEYEFIPIN